MTFGQRWTPPPRARDMEPPPLPVLRPVAPGTYKGSTSGIAVAKENAIQHEGYMSIVRGLACRRCGYQPPEGEPRNQFAHSDAGKGKGIKTDCRRGASLCGPHGGINGCHWVLGTSGQFTKLVRRQLEDEYAESTREEVIRLGLWPKSLPRWEA